MGSDLSCLYLAQMFKDNVLDELCIDNKEVDFGLLFFNNLPWCKGNYFRTLLFGGIIYSKIQTQRL